MTMGFIYPEVIAKIRAVCSKHIAGLASADDMQHTIQYGEITIAAIEENDIQTFLTDIEGKLELIKFTVDDNKQFLETQEIARRVLTWLNERERKYYPPNS